MNPALRPAELAHALRHSQPRELIHADRSRNYDTAAVVSEIDTHSLGVRSISLSSRAEWRSDNVDAAVIVRAPTDPEQPVMLQYTSGTTGAPKGVLLRHRSLVNVAKLTLEVAGIPAGAVTVNPLPMFHTAACVVGTLGPLWIGGTEVLVGRLNRPQCSIPCGASTRRSCSSCPQC